MTELEKMTRGLKYDALDKNVMAARLRAHDLCHALSQLKPLDLKARAAILRELLPCAPEDIFITPPFFCDYGWNIRVGKKFYCNTGCVILDGAPVTIGDNVMFWPNVRIYTPIHALDPAARANLAQWTAPVNIGDRVWIGGGAIVCANVKVGADSVIAPAAWS